MSIHPVSGPAPGAQPRLAPPPAVGVPAEPAAPDGASFWEILTPEERAFFAQQAALGPLSYRPGGAPVAGAAPTGQRLDVRA